MIEHPDSLLDAVYDTAADPDTWRTVLTQIADLTGSHGGILFGQSAEAVAFDYNGRLSEECNQAYKERHVANPWNLAMSHQPVGRVVLSDEVVPLAPLRRSLFFEEVLRPQDVAHNAMVALAARDDFCVAFNLCRGDRQGPLDVGQTAWLQQLVPHMRRSIGLAFRVDGYRALREGQFGILDRLSVGVVLLDHRAYVLYANAAARALSASNGPIHLRRETATVHSPPHAQRLTSLIRAALRGVPSSSISVPRGNDEPPLTILVSSVRGKDMGRFADLRMLDAAVMLFIIDPANRAGTPPSLVMDAFGLTRAEARVALAVSSGLGIPEAAIRLGLSTNTVKTHLRRVFAKTGVDRQADLVRLMTTIGLVAFPSTDRSD